MSDFRRLTDTIWASPQITVDDVARAANEGFALVINNRPDGEAKDQPAGDEIAAAAQEHGLGYMAIPVGHSGFSEPQIAAMTQALDSADGKVLAYCRSGTRSTLLWAMAEASRGRDPSDLAQSAQSAGYDLAPIAPMLEMLAARSKG